MNDMKMEGVRQEVTESRAEYPEKVLETVPSLCEGINLVEGPGDHPVFQEILAHELDPGERALWIDTGNRASTYALSSADESLMDRVEISRSFTPFQHYTAVQRMAEQRTDVSVVVLPLVTHLYLDSGMSPWERRELFAETWETIRSFKEEVRVAVSLPDERELSSLVRGEADRKVEVRKTGEGIRYSSEGFTQKTYRQSGVLQTTIPMWRRV